MKTGLITIATVASVMILSGTAFAGGENCPSKSGAHKDMSAAATKEGADHHGGLKLQDAVKANTSAATAADAPKEAPAKSTEAVLKI